MGRGKKDKKERKSSTQDVEKAVEELSISEEGTSTSHAEIPPDQEDEGLSAAAKRKKKKEEKKAALVSLQAPQKPEVEKPVAPEPEPAPVTKTEVVEEEVGLGLGLGGGRKRQKKKPQAAAKAQAPPGPVASEPQPSSSLAQPAVSLPQTPGQAAPVSWGQARRPLSSVPAPPTVASPAIVASPGSAPPATATPWSAQAPSRPFPTAGGGRGRGRGQPLPMTAAPSSAPWAGDMAQPSHSQATVSAPAPTSSPTGPVTQPIKSDTVSCRFKIPKKIEGGLIPHRKVTVLTNYLAMKIQPLQIFRYDVSFKPDRPKKMLGKAFTLSKERHFPRTVTAFDQIKNCYSLTALKDVTQNDRYITNVVMTDNNGKEMKFEVSYKFTGIVDLKTIINYMNTGGTSLSPPTEAIQCIDVILRQGTLESYVKAGRQFFKRPSRPINLGDGLEIWTGLFQSGIFTSKPFVNIDVAHKGFPKQQPMIQALQEFRLNPQRSLDKQNVFAVENFKGFIRGLRVVASIGGDNSSRGQKREFICNGVSAHSATREYFMMEDASGKKTRMSVAEYFSRIKNVRLQYPDLNCVWVGSREKTIYYPMELLEVAYGQALNKQLNEMQLSTMVRQAATPPDERKKKIEEVISDMNYSKNEYFQKFGLQISDKFYPVDAKVLHPPKLDVGTGRSIEPRRGAWQADRMLKPEALQHWGIIAIETNNDRCDYDNTIRLLMNTGRQMGMNVAPPALCRFDVQMRNLQEVLVAAVKNNINFMFVIVSYKGRDYYHKVKQLAERDVGILTQCIKEATHQSRMNQQTARNILLKVNSKLMGINQVLDNCCLPKCLQGGGVMVVGADVTHPSPDQSNIPSIAAVTASIDTKCFLYNIELSIQTPKKEMIVEFEDMMVEHLKVYRNNQKALPKKIFVFRDGVSEGQFAQVMNSELQAVHDAYRKLAGPDVKPEVLFLLVQKRHHTRLFLPNSSQNVDPGTVVDKDIVHASELDFYLVSHHAIKGTARPTRYHAVCNDGRIPHDEVEQLTYYLCHLYSRCMRSVSYPTPTYYAHLACLRARSLTQ
ncbi:hypothetical protein ABMA28_002265 [Loxostege sticticalis]|uniref:Protein argonaute-2 n=1 Tax=Loxostege sticticalis TaxID=481309 RepID=A0ABD0T0N3_LOXSC